MIAVGTHILVARAVAMSRRAATTVSGTGCQPSGLEAVASAVAGRVHSVFRHCFNITTPGGEWLTVAIAPFPQTPDAIIVNAPGGFMFAVEPHMPVEIFPDKISISDAEAVIALAGANIFDTRRSPFARVGDNHAHTLKNLLIARETIHCEGRTCDVPEFLFRAEPALHMLREAILRDDAVSMRAQCERLLGLGIGLTPSGDDILGGVAAGLFLGGAAEAGGGRQFLSVLRDLLGDGARTTDVSARSLLLCIEGEINGIVYGAVRAILRGDESGTKHAVRALLAQGGTSGAEMAQGLCLGIQIAEEFLCR